MSERVDAYSTSLLTIDPQTIMHYVGTPNVADLFARYARSEIRLKNVRPRRAMETAPFSFVRDIDIMTPDEISDDEIYNTFMRPMGLGWSMGSALLEPSGHHLIFDFMRRTELGPFTDAHLTVMNGLRADLARAAFISSRLVFQHAQSVSNALALVGLPAAVLDHAGRVLAMNDLMEAQAPRIRTGAVNRLVVDHAPAGDLLRSALLGIAGKGAQGVQSIPVPAVDEAAPLILHVLPVRRNAQDLFSRGLAVMIVSPVGLAGSPDLRVLSGLFDLTPGEARVAQHLAGGASLEATAGSLGITVETVRTYLKRIFLKTGTRRQSELVRLLSGLGRIAA